MRARAAASRRGRSLRVSLACSGALGPTCERESSHTELARRFRRHPVSLIGDVSLFPQANRADAPTGYHDEMRAVVILVFAAFATVVVALLGYLAHSSVVGYRLECERPGDACRLAQQRLLETSVSSVPVSRLRRAFIEIVPAGRAPPRVFLKLRSTDATYFVAEYEGSDADHNAANAADEINAFLADPSHATLSISVRQPILYAVAWILGALVLLLVIAGGTLAYRSVASPAPGG